MTKKETERQEAIQRLHEWLKPGDTVYTVLEHVSRSGMSRTIRVLLLSCEGGKVTHLHPNHAVATAIGARLSSVRGRDGLVIGGCGMDMGFHVVHSLSAAMYRDGFGCIGKNCPSNDHSNGDRDYRPHGAFAPEQAVKLPSGLYDAGSQSYYHWHKHGDSALRHEWL